jgi:hypothetical protein
MQWQIIVGFMISAEILAAQQIHLKARIVEGSEIRMGVRRGVTKRWRPGRNHYLLQFKTPINDEIREALILRGAVITGTVPDDAVMVTAGDDFSAEGLDVVFSQEMNPEDKASPLLGTHGNDSAFIVEFHGDVDPEAARALLRSEGVTIVEHPDLTPANVLVLGSVDDTDRLKQWDEVAYVFPAPAEMVDGERFHQCTGALSSGMAVAQYVRVGHGWSPDFSGHVNLGYFFGELTGKVPNATVTAEVLRAMDQWSKVARVQFVAASSASALQSIAVKFAVRDHGDGFPFDGPSGILAHTFYPTNPEPIAGDLHLDGEEGWHAGTNVDVYTVALHELGHALGLGHSDQPGAIMYPYYRFPAQIGVDDIAGIQSIYGAPVQTTTTPAIPPFSISFKSPVTTAIPVNTTAINLTGNMANASGVTTVSWVTNHGASGRASVAGLNWSASAVPTRAGSSTITVTATDAQHHTATKAVTVVRPVATVLDQTPPMLSIASPLGTNVQTSLATIAVFGTASDNIEVTRVTWQNGSAGSGTSVGTTSWSAAQIPLLIGTNIVVIRAYDAAGNSSWRSVIVTRH